LVIAHFPPKEEGDPGDTRSEAVRAVISEAVRAVISEAVNAVTIISEAVISEAATSPEGANRILDTYVPTSVAGFGIGANIVGFPGKG
jgi:hypothetical protein